MCIGCVRLCAVVGRCMQVCVGMSKYKQVWVCMGGMTEQVCSVRVCTGLGRCVKVCRIFPKTNYKFSE